MCAPLHPPRASTHSTSTPASATASTAAIVDDHEGFEPERDAIAYALASPSSSSSSGDVFDD